MFSSICHQQRREAWRAGSPACGIGKETRRSHLPALQDDIEPVEAQVIAMGPAERGARHQGGAIGQAPDIKRFDGEARGVAAGDDETPDGGSAQMPRSNWPVRAATLSHCPAPAKADR